MTTQRKKNRFTKVSREQRSHAERQWYRRMKIWHALDQNPGLIATEVARLRGVWPSQVNSDLREMSGVRCERVNANVFRWYATD